MPNKLSDGKRRVSMAEEIEILNQLRDIARKEGKTLTDIYQEAAREFLKKRSKRK